MPAREPVSRRLPPRPRDPSLAVRLRRGARCLPEDVAGIVVNNAGYYRMAPSRPPRPPRLHDCGLDRLTPPIASDHPSSARAAPPTDRQYISLLSHVIAHDSDVIPRHCQSSGAHCLQPGRVGLDPTALPILLAPLPMPWDHVRRDPTGLREQPSTLGRDPTALGIQNSALTLVPALGGPARRPAVAPDVAGTWSAEPQGGARAAPPPRPR